LIPAAEPIAGIDAGLKAGTAQKTTLNLLSTLLMIQLGHVYDGLMVDVQATNQKSSSGAARTCWSAWTNCKRDDGTRRAEAGPTAAFKLAVMLLHDCDLEAGRAIARRGARPASARPLALLRAAGANTDAGVTRNRFVGTPGADRCAAAIMFPAHMFRLGKPRFRGLIDSFLERTSARSIDLLWRD